MKYHETRYGTAEAKTEAGDLQALIDLAGTDGKLVFRHTDVGWIRVLRTLF